MPANGKALSEQYNRRKAMRSTHEPDWQLLGEFVHIVHQGITTTRTPGAKKTQRLFDSSGPHAARLLSASLVGAMMPTSLKFFTLVARDRMLRNLKSVRDWLEDVRDIALLTLSQSNFAAEILATMLDLGTFGTGCLFEMEAPAKKAGAFGGLIFKARAVGTYVIGEAADGTVDCLQYEYELEGGNFATEFPGAVLPQEIAEQVKKEPEKNIKVLHSIYPRKGRGPMRTTGKNKAWASCHTLLEHPECVLREGGYEEFPAMVPRWEKASNEVYGTAPAHIALPDIRSLNRAVELYLAAAGKAVDPPLAVPDDGVIGPLTLEPAGINVIRRGEKIEVIESKQRFDVAQQLHERLERKISEVMYLDALRLRFKPNMTATEVIALQEEMLRLIGPTAGRLHSELLSKIIERTIAILARAGQLPDPPAELVGFDVDFDIQYEGPLARAQKSADLSAIARVEEHRMKIAAAGHPEVYDNFDLDGEAQHVAMVAGYPGTFIKDQGDVTETRKARDKATLEAAKLDKMSQMAQAGGDLAPLVKAGQQAQEPVGAAA